MLEPPLEPPSSDRWKGVPAGAERGFQQLLEPFSRTEIQFLS